MRAAQARVACQVIFDETTPQLGVTATFNALPAHNAAAVPGGAMTYQEPNLAWPIVTTGDLNGDAKADLIWWNDQTGQVYGMLMSTIPSDQISP